MSKLYLHLILILILFCLSGGFCKPVHASPLIEDSSSISCEERTLRDHYRNSDVIFEGEVIKVPVIPYINQRSRFIYTFKVIKTWKGIENQEVTVYSSYSSGPPPNYGFENGRKYLVYALGSDSLKTDACTRTRPVELAAHDIEFMKRLPESMNKNFTIGTAHFCENSKSNMMKLPPSEGIKVKLSNSSNSYTAVTDNRGVYAIEDIAPGIYFVTVSSDKMGIVRFENHNEEITAGNGMLEVETNSIIENYIVLSYPNDIDGIVLNRNGDIMKDTYVDLVPEYYLDNQDSLMSSVEEFYSPVTLTCPTNMFGKFHFKNVPPGNYYLGLNLLMSNITGGQKIYYPGTKSVGDAETIEIKSFTKNREISFQLVPYKYYKIEGMVKLSDGTSAQELHVVISKDEVDNFTSFIDYCETKEGIFSINIKEDTEGWLQIMPALNNILKINGKSYELPKPIKIEPNRDYLNIELILREKAGQ